MPSNSKMVPEEDETKDKVLLGLGPILSLPSTLGLNVAFIYQG